jgi:hypothetical protein
MRWLEALAVASAALAVAAGAASAEVVREPYPIWCETENNYGRSMAALRSGHLAVGGDGEFCGLVDILDPTGARVTALLDTDDTSFGVAVGAIGNDVLVGSRVSGRLLRIAPETATIRVGYDLPGGPHDSASAIATFGRRVAVLASRTGEPDVVHVFDARTGELRLTIPNPEPQHRLRPVLVAFGRRLAIADWGGTVRLLDPKTGAVRLSLPDMGPAIAADGKLMAVAGAEAVHLFDRRGRIVRTLRQPGADCFGAALALRGDALLVGAPCTTVVDFFEGTAHLYSARTGTLHRSYAGLGENEKLGSTVALLPRAVALGGRGDSTADNGIVRIAPR